MTRWRTTKLTRSKKAAYRQGVYTFQGTTSSSTAPIDPGEWPAVSDAVRTEMVEREPYQVIGDFQFPKRKDERSCHHYYFSRKLSNKEKVKRCWLVYSQKKKIASTVSAASSCQTKTTI